MAGPKAAELATQSWDAVIVGGGHNGLTAAAYLARAGRSVLVLERRDQVGGACTLERPFSDPRFVISPCAYLVGLLHPLVIEELALARYGYRTFVCDPTQWTPFEDGSSLTQWLDEDRTAKEIHALAPGDVDGYVAYVELFRRIRSRLRAGGDPARDTWIGDAPDRAALEELFADDPEAREVLFEASIADVVERHVRDERLRIALHGQGIIGTYAGPRDPGTAWIHAMHSLGLIGGWSYVEGGMGRISFCLADAARDAGAVVATGMPVAADRARRGRPPRRRRDRASRRRRLERGSSAHPRVVRRRRAGHVPLTGRRVAVREPGRQGELRALPAPDVHRRARSARSRVPRPGRDRARDRRHPVGVRRVLAAASRRPNGARSTSRRPTTRRSHLPAPTR